MERGNERPGAHKDAGPIDTFKRAVASTLRAISARTDVTVTYATGPATATGGQAKLPTPSRRLGPEDVAGLRGRPTRWRYGCATITIGCMPAACRPARRRARSTTPSSRPGSRRWAGGCWPA